MKKFIKKDFAESIYIGLSLMLLWAPAVFIISDLDASKFSTAFLYRTWMNFFGLLTSLFIFHVLLDLIQKRRPRVLWVSAAVIVVIAILTVGYIYWLKLGMLLNTYPKAEEATIDIGYWLRASIYQLYGICYFIAIKLSLRYLKLKNRNQQLLLEKKTSELNFLKSQTNPHFLFNTLNSIYALARDKSDLTADSVMRLSDILRYMLYETHSALISIDKEIEIIEEYIELERMRYDESLQVIFEKEIDNPEQKIPPLLLIHLIENAFKHGAAETINTPLIVIKLSSKANRILFSVENSIGENSISDDVKDNIGLTNLRRQLGLLFKDHRLNIKRHQNSFSVSMEINLNSYAQN